MEKIAIIKTGWSDDFTGSPVEASHAHVREYADGSERFNFLPGPDGRWYAYTPPIGKKMVPPKPKQLGGWLVFSVAKKPGEKGLYLTGWYEDAAFTGEFLDRPEYKLSPPGLPRDEEGNPYHYVLSAPRAVRVDPRAHAHVFPGDNMKRASVFYLRGNGAKERWREELAQRLLQIREQWDANAESDQVSVLSDGMSGICGDATRRKEVEAAAVACVLAHFPISKYEIEDCQKRNLGYDFVVRSKKSGEELHVEVKGTQNASAHFLMSRKEYKYMQAFPERWRLAMVTQALSATPHLKVMDAAEAARMFRWEEFTWHATSGQ